MKAATRTLYLNLSMVRRGRAWKQECKCPLYFLVVCLFLSGIILTVYGRVHKPFYTGYIPDCKVCEKTRNDELRNMANSNIAGPIVLVCGLLMVYVVFKYSKWLTAVELDMKEKRQIEQRFRNMATVPASSSSQSNASELSSAFNRNGYAVNPLSLRKPVELADDAGTQNGDNSLSSVSNHNGCVTNPLSLSESLATSSLKEKIQDGTYPCDTDAINKSSLKPEEELTTPQSAVRNQSIRSVKEKSLSFPKVIIAGPSSFSDDESSVPHRNRYGSVTTGCKSLSI